MYFKKLEIFGFKSFAEKTALNFEPGITAIVGPNGCGKSNVFDAIRWVLGEQSIKELRGANKEDIIFNGTDRKSPLGFAEVNLTFSNESRMLPIEYDEVTISRRLYRSGESQYLLNKSIVRLKDIQELIMGTGIGAQAYSMVQQGRVDMVVNSKPEERRSILDEASGITKYKAKKREALNKLKATEDNLLRVNDITVEVKRQIGSIERQANKARKYKEEFEKLKALELRIARKQMNEFVVKKEELIKAIRQMQERDRELQEQIEESNNLLTHETEQLAEIEQRLNEINAQDIKLDNQIDVNNRQIGFNQERIENINNTKQRLAEQKEQLIEKCRVQQEKIEELKNNITELNETNTKNEEELQSRRDELSAVDRSIEEAKQTIQDQEEKIISLNSTQIDVRNCVTDAIKEMQGALARKRRLELENNKVAGERQEVDQKLQNAEYQFASIQGTVKELEDQCSAKGQVLDELTNRFEQIQKTIGDLEQRKMFFKSQKDFIEKMAIQYEDIPDPIVEGRLLTQSVPRENQSGIIGKIKEVRSLDSHSLSVFKRKDSKELYEIICETKFIELDPQKILNQISEVDREIEEALAQKENIQNEIKEHQQILAQIQQEIHNKEKALSVLIAQKQDIQEESKKLINEKESIDSELAEVSVSIETIKKKEDELNYKLESLDKELAWTQNDIKGKQQWINERSVEKEEITINVTQLETEIETFKDRLDNQHENLKLFSETLDNWLGEMKNIDDEVASYGGKIEEYNKENQELQVKIEEVRVSKEALKDQQTQEEALKSEINQKVESIRAHISSYEDEIIEIKQQNHKVEMKEQELSFKEKEIKDRLEQSYKIDYEDLPKEEETEDSEQEPINLEESLVEIQRLRKRCNSFGNVNLAAMDEYEELKERFEFLTSQQADLIEAKSQLMSTINKINRSTRQMFIDTFNKVNEEFRIHYRMLFGGGDAQLILLDPENVLESGIDIVARPPGKKLQNITLMSGGEKTLTAIALIFGVFKVNPSPFCVLDEIDAALDESNVGRFSYMLKDFAKIAQFIVITHNKKTISAADVMYGVTMPETGISRIVSVKFSENNEVKTSEPVAAGV